MTPRIAGSGGLLNGVDDLMDEDVAPGGVVRGVFAAAENEVGAEGEGARAMVGGEAVCGGIGVEADGAEIETEERLKAATNGLGER